MRKQQQIGELLKLAAYAVLEEGDEFVPMLELLEAEYKRLAEDDALQRAKRILEKHTL